MEFVSTLFLNNEREERRGEERRGAEKRREEKKGKHILLYTFLLKTEL